MSISQDGGISKPQAAPLPARNHHARRSFPPDVIMNEGDRRSGNSEPRNCRDRGLHRDLGGVGTAVAHAALPSWLNIIAISCLIFGGCCANVFALEAIIKDQPSCGPLVTFAQFVLTALFTLPSFFSLRRPQSLFLNPRAIPLSSWLVYTAYFLTVNMLNNWAFAYKISVPLHIIVRSGGPVASMIVGYLYNSKRYSRLQVLAVVMLTIGVVGAALADAASKGQSMGIGIVGSAGDSSSFASSLIGFSILALAMILSAFQGIYADKLYETHGRSHWREALFYSHILSLPFFLPTFRHLALQYRLLTSSPPLLKQVSVFCSDSPEDGNGATITNESSSFVSTALAMASAVSGGSFASNAPSASPVLAVVTGHDLVRSIVGRIPVKVAYLATNALTQYLCIRGVHLLSAKSSSLTVTIVLNVRKLVSLLLSIYLFGNELASGILVGSVLVFVGGGLYGLEGARLRKKTHSVKRD